MKYFFHSCVDSKELIQKFAGGYGYAISSITKIDNGNWIADNGEYATIIRFCPFCGVFLDDTLKQEWLLAHKAINI